MAGYTARSWGRRPSVRLVTAASTVILVGVLAACGSSGSTSGTKSDTSNGLTEVRVGANLNAGSLATYVGIDKGFFAKHHLSVKLTPVLNLTLIPSQVGNQFDFGQSVQPILINAAKSGLPVVATGGGEVESADVVDGGVIVKKTSNIKSAADLAGKRVAVLTANGNTAYALQFWMKKKGVDPNSVKLTVVAAPNMINELKAGQVDAIYAVSPFAAQALTDPANEMLINPELEVGANVSQGAILISNKQWAQSHKDTVLAFEQAQTDAIAWIEANPDAAVAILNKYTGSKSAPGTKLPPITATENADDLRVWINVMEQVVPNFSTTLTPQDLLFEPILDTNYTAQQ